MNVKRGANAPARAHGAQAARPRKAARAGLARPARRFVTSDRNAACS
ncbi:hypothetical protein X985_234 [Burkholderia pseudomallei MSHR4012]|nr:hypothetical protein BURPS668_1047 [Burkholderia pseudomallei 668]AJX88329.1 hypothetical protein BH02_3061 [Burkholderia pseudomallei]KGV45856.1 hypothetical protein X985_234 [Burkholderia pseudomallei MSHR4012]KGV50115.1 hypothetical protein X983_150 [Burkholderia pseudomallei MSHR4003]KGV76042.1 hypothetical protein X890_3143 [Burkholderia pseudomallei MSHR4299]